MSKQFTLAHACLVLLVVTLPLPFVLGDQTKTQADGTVEKKHGYAPVNGLKMYYEMHGASGTPLVLLHGGGSSIESTFGMILSALAKSRQVVAFEQQGHGRTSDVADRPFTFEQSADDAAALLAHLKIKQADLLGFSNGGHITMQVAIRHPKVVRKLVVASAGFKRDGHPPEFWEFMKQAKLETMPKALRDEYARLSPHPEKLPTFFDKSVKRMREFKDFPVEDIRSIKAPTLVMIGDADNVRPEHAVEMFRLLPHGKLAVLPGGHGAYIGEVTAARLEGAKVQFGDAKRDSKLPDAVVTMIEEFLDAPLPEAKVKKSAAAPKIGRWSGEVAVQIGTRPHGCLPTLRRTHSSGSVKPFHAARLS